MVASLDGPAAARRRLLLVRASFATDRMIRHRSIRMICAGPSVSVACCTTAAWPWWPCLRTPTARFGWKIPALGWRTADPGIEELTGRDCRRGHRFRYAGARDGEALASPPGFATAARSRPGTCASG